MNKGFTLAELMGVIIILAILSVIVTTAIDRNIIQGRVDTCKTQERNVIEAAKMYVTDHPEILPNGTKTKSDPITINKLIVDGYLDSEIENPMTQKAYNNNDAVIISVTSTDGNANKDYKYTVKYVNSEDACTE